MLTEIIAGLAARFQLADVYVFGSRAAEIAYRLSPARLADATAPSRPAAAPESDVDLAVRMRARRRLTAAERVELTQAFEDALGVERVDLLILQEAEPFLALAAIRGELLFCTDRTSQAEYELYVLRRAGDLAPLEHDRRELVLRGGR